MPSLPEWFEVSRNGSVDGPHGDLAGRCLFFSALLKANDEWQTQNRYMQTETRVRARLARDEV
jgi:hypothetical protein